MAKVKWHFNGGIRTVTGSCHILQVGDKRLLVDLGLPRNIDSRFSLNLGNGPSTSAISAEVAYASPVRIAVSAPVSALPSSES